MVAGNDQKVRLKKKSILDLLFAANPEDGFIGTRIQYAALAIVSVALLFIVLSLMRRKFKKQLK